MFRQQAGRAPMVPNASRVRGRLIGIEPEPDGNGANWEIALDEAQDVDGLPNFARAYTGQVIQVYVHPELQTDVSEKDRLEARVSYRGDERGGRFALVEDDVRKL